MSWPAAASSRGGNIIVNPSGTNPGITETHLRCAAWWVLDLSPAWGFPPLRGQNVVIPEDDGQRVYPTRIDQGVYTMPIQICGDVDRDASATPSGAIQGLRDNIGDLWENVFSPSPSASYREAILVEPNGNEIAFRAQFKAQLGRQQGSEAWAAFDMIVPAGRIE